MLAKIDSLILYGPKPSATSTRTGLVSFNSRTIHATDLSFFLDQEGVAVRTGNCIVFDNYYIVLYYF